MGAHIDINDDHELYIWARTLRVTQDELVRLVGEVGPSAERVRDKLKRAEIGRSGGRTPREEPSRHAAASRVNGTRTELDPTGSLSTDLASHIARARADLEERMLGLGLKADDGWRIAEEVRSSMSGSIVVLRPIHVKFPGPDIEIAVQIGHDGRTL